MFSITKVNDKGVNTIYYTHYSFISEKTRKLIADSQKNLKQIKSIVPIFGGLGTYLGFKLVPKSKFLSKIPVWAAFPIGFLATYFAIDYQKKSQYSKTLLKALSEDEAIPLWTNKNNVLNLDKIYFQLDDQHGQQPNMFYHGMTQNLVFQTKPDGFIGKPVTQPIPPTENHQAHH